MDVHGEWGVNKVNKYSITERINTKDDYSRLAMTVPISGIGVSIITYRIAP